MSINDGGPAFPVDSYGKRPGMSLRDWFAGQAMAAIINKIPACVGGRQDHHTYETVARGAYNYADAILAVRQQKEPSA
jgi:hypothetical protein